MAPSTAQREEPGSGSPARGRPQFSHEISPSGSKACVRSGTEETTELVLPQGRPNEEELSEDSTKWHNATDKVQNLGDVTNCSSECDVEIWLVRTGTSTGFSGQRSML